MKKYYVKTNRPVGRPATSRTTKVCQYCDAEFTTRTKARFCSKPCAAKNRGMQKFTPEQEQKRREAVRRNNLSEVHLDRLRESSYKNHYGYYEPLDPIFPSDDNEFF